MAGSRSRRANVSGVASRTTSASTVGADATANAALNFKRPVVAPAISGPKVNPMSPQKRYRPTAVPFAPGW